mgnify:FL=1
MSIESECMEYVNLLDSPPNGWGQHKHSKYGQSHFFLMYLYKTYGNGRVQACIDSIYANKLAKLGVNND